jgi:uncharacterized protein (DUF1015 family)
MKVHIGMLARMAAIRPFQGLRYSAEAGALGVLTAPPYDVISVEERISFGMRSPHNIVHLTLPEQKSDDRSKFVKYARSAALLAEWRREGVLLLEEKPAIYRYRQTFTLPHLGVLTRTSIIALIKVEPYSKGVVLPHEETFPKHKEDRLRILEATRAHLESIFGLVEDPDGQIHDAVVNAPAGATVETVSDDSTDQMLEPITDPEAVNHLVGLFQDKKVWIADGHHRYETAVAFREALGEQPGPVAEDYMMIALSSMSDPGLVLLPTHRVLTDIPVDEETMFARLEEHFKMHEMHNTRLMAAVEHEKRSGRVAFGLAREGGDGFLLEARDPEALYAMVPRDQSDDLRRLDVTVLHSVILDQLLEVPGLDTIKYTRDSHQAVEWVNEGAKAAFLMNPPTVDDMRRIALGGEKMPQKSTYYFPKILSGMVLWSLNDFNT